MRTHLHTARKDELDNMPNNTIQQVACHMLPSSDYVCYYNLAASFTRETRSGSIHFVQ